MVATAPFGIVGLDKLLAASFSCALGHDLNQKRLANGELPEHQY
jgi:hypothetical protein